MGTRYQRTVAVTSTARGSLEEVVWAGAQEMLRRALEDEVERFLQRGPYERSEEFRGYRNGTHPERAIGIGLGSVKVRVPRVRDVPETVAPQGFQSQVVERYQRRSQQQQLLFQRLYLEGLSSGDFEPVFRELLGGEAPLSESTILRLKTTWEAEYEEWRQRELGEHRYAYVWFDGVYGGGGQER